MTAIRLMVLSILLALTASAFADAPAVPPPSMQAQVGAVLAAAPTGTRFGLLVVDDAGKVIASVNPDGRFIPASNTKLFTTAAAYALLPGMDQPDKDGGAQVYLHLRERGGVSDVALVGRGDARMSSAADCKSDCLATLADAIAAKTIVVGDVIGDDTWFPSQRWSPGMSWNNIGSNDATAASALSLDSNELLVSAAPSTVGNHPVVVAPPYVTIRNEAVTIAAGGKVSLSLEHQVNSREFRIYGELPVDAAEWHERIGIDDPAHFAAWTLADMLRARGVRVTGEVRANHRSIGRIDDPAWHDEQETAAAFGRTGDPVAGLTPQPLSADVAIINKVSQNHHAELMLRRIGSQEGFGSLADGLAAERALFAAAGIPREGYDFSDGSGMSTYNRVSPRAAVILLRWIAVQLWGKAWYASLPIAGVDGTLKRRFIGTPLAANLIAKTGSLYATNALSGTFRAASGQTLTFAFFANDVPEGQSAVPAMEAVLLLIAASN